MHLCGHRDRKNSFHQTRHRTVVRLLPFTCSLGRRFWWPSCRFSPADVQSLAPGLINVILTKLRSAGNPEKVAENDFLMKCEISPVLVCFRSNSSLLGVMRVVITARQTLATTGYEQILQQLVGILGVVSKNPSNPNFDQYLFETLSALMRSANLFLVTDSGAKLTPALDSLFLQIRLRFQYLRQLYSGHLRLFYNKI